MVGGGRERGIREDVFGDESVIGSIAVYALVALPSEHVESANALMDVVKSAAGVPNSARVHCRELLHPDRRRRSPWAHLTDDNVWKLLNLVAKCLAPVGARFHVGMLDRAILPPELYAEDGERLRMPIGEKEAVWLAYTAAIVALDQSIGLDAVRLWTDPDRSLMQFFGKRKQVRLALSQVFSSASGRTTQAQPEPICEPKPGLLEVADVLAYAVAQAVSRQASRHKQHCQYLMRTFSPSISCMVLDTQGFLRAGVGPEVFATFQEQRRRRGVAV